MVTGVAVAFPGVLGPESVLVHREHYINITTVSNCAGAVGRWPDALIPARDPYDHQERNAFPASIAAGTNQAFWVDIFVPDGTAAGTHAGTVTVDWAETRSAGGGGGGGGATASPTMLPLALTVHPFTLPSISRYQTTYGCPINGILAGRFLGKAPANTSHANRVLWQKQYVDLGLMHRVTFSDFLGADPCILGHDSTLGTHIICFVRQFRSQVGHSMPKS